METHAEAKEKLLDMWEKIVAEWEKDREAASPISSSGLCKSVHLFNHLFRPDTHATALRTLALFEPQQKRPRNYWFPRGECREERATIAAFCWALTEAWDYPT